MVDTLSAKGIASPALDRLSRDDARRGPGWTRRLLRRKPSAVAAFLLTVVVAGALAAPLAAPYDPLEMHPRDRFAHPSWTYPFGTDETGRDLLSRVLYGARVSILVGLGAVAVSFAFGVLPGFVAAYRGGRTDAVIMRLLDGLLAFPGLLLALTVVAMLGPSMVNATLAIGVVGTPIVARLTRAVVLVERGRDYVLAARALGATDRRIAFRAIMPNCLAPLVVQASLTMAAAIQTEAALSFIGLGIQPPDSSLGSLLYAAYGYISRSGWYMIFPGLAIFTVVWSLSVLGDGLRDSLDPRLRTT
jgi:ABC-type dipeptide/oligopeptide/nickel transport system permease subunit